nr:RNA methyltransferase [Caviibacter abscessus]
MCNVEYIESKENKNYKLLKKLSKKKYRDENNIFIAEGEKFLEDNKNFTKIIISSDKFEYFNDKYDLSKYDKITVLKTSLFNELSTQENSQGIIFIYSKNACSLSEISSDVIILDDVQDPGNVGTIIRTMVALEYKNLILTKGSVDVYTPKAVRASMGGIFNINVIYSKYDEIIKFLKNNNYRVFATALDNRSIDYRDIKLNDNKNAYIFGHEGGGISKTLLDISDYKTIIPISSNINSLNVSVASAVFLYKVREIEKKI